MNKLFDAIDATVGDIRMLPGYEKIQKYVSNVDAIEHLDMSAKATYLQTKTLMSLLEQHRDEFVLGYRTGTAFIINVYQIFAGCCVIAAARGVLDLDIIKNNIYWINEMQNGTWAQVISQI